MRDLRAGQAMEPLTIGALAKRTGVGVETVRFYERQGLLARPARPGRGYRKYPDSAVERIHFIRHAQSLGFSLEDIAGLLALKLTSGSSCAAVRGKAAAKLADVETRIAKLEEIRSALEKLVAACPGRGALATCTILEALEASAPTSQLMPQGPRRRDRKSTRLNSSHIQKSRMPSSA